MPQYKFVKIHLRNKPKNKAEEKAQEIALHCNLTLVEVAAYDAFKKQLGTLLEQINQANKRTTPLVCECFSGDEGTEIIQLSSTTTLIVYEVKNLY